MSLLHESQSTQTDSNSARLADASLITRAQQFFGGHSFSLRSEALNTRNPLPSGDSSNSGSNLDGSSGPLGVPPSPENAASAPKGLNQAFATPRNRKRMRRNYSSSSSPSVSNQEDVFPSPSLHQNARSRSAEPSKNRSILNMAPRRLQIKSSFAMHHEVVPASSSPAVNSQIQTMVNDQVEFSKGADSIRYVLDDARRNRKVCYTTDTPVLEGPQDSSLSGSRQNREHDNDMRSYSSPNLSIACAIDTLSVPRVERYGLGTKQGPVLGPNPPLLEARQLSSRACESFLEPGDRRLSERSEEEVHLESLLQGIGRSANSVEASQLTYVSGADSLEPTQVSMDQNDGLLCSMNSSSQHTVDDELVPRSMEKPTTVETGSGPLPTSRLQEIPRYRKLGRSSDGAYQTGNEKLSGSVPYDESRPASHICESIANSPPLEDRVPPRSKTKRRVVTSESESDDVVSGTDDSIITESRTVRDAPTSNVPFFDGLPVRRGHEQFPHPTENRPSLVQPQNRYKLHGPSERGRTPASPPDESDVSLAAIGESRSSTEPEAENDETYRPPTSAAKSRTKTFTSTRSSKRSNRTDSGSVSETTLKRKRRSTLRASTPGGSVDGQATGDRACDDAGERRSRKRSKLKPIPPVPNQKTSRVFARWPSDRAYYSGTITGMTVKRLSIYFDDQTTGDVEWQHVRKCVLYAGDQLVDLSRRPLREVIVTQDSTDDLGPESQFLVKRDKEEYQLSAKAIRIREKHIAQMNDRRLSPDLVQVDQELPVDRPRQGKSRCKTPLDATVNTRIESSIFSGFGFLVTSCHHNEEYKRKKMMSRILAHGGVCVDEVWDFYTKPGLDHLQQGYRTIRFKETTINTRLRGIFLIVIGTPTSTPKFLMSLAIGIPCLSANYIEEAILGTISWHCFILSSGYSLYLEAECSQIVDPKWGDDGSLLRQAMDNSTTTRRPFWGKDIMIVGSSKMNVSMHLSCKTAPKLTPLKI
jgi:hypothetical protein